jgi:hypothetical protein
MKYTDEQLDSAVENDIFTMEQITKFKEYVQNSNDQITKLQKILYYGGALLIISAMTWLMKTSWDNFGAIALTIISAFFYNIFNFWPFFIF